MLIGLENVIPEGKPELLFNLSKDRASDCFELSTDADWTYLKAQYVLEVSKKREEAKVNIVLPKSVRVCLRCMSLTYPNC